MTTADVDLLICGAEVVTGGARHSNDVAVRDGSIVAMEPHGTIAAGAAHAVVDATGAMLLPGGIDAHVHAGPPFCDDLDVVASGAAAGGITTLGVYAHARPEDDPPAAARYLAEWATDTATDVVLHWRLHRDAPVPTQIEAATSVGITTFKVFMSYRARGLQWTDGEILEAMRLVGAAGGRMSVHAECGDIIHALEVHRPVQDADSFLGARPPETESEAVRRALVLGRLAACPVLIPHLSSAEGLAAYTAERGADDALETCPQYLELDEDDFRRHGTLAKIGPPLRSAADVEALRAAVEDGTVDVLGSDHAPYTVAEKDVPMDLAPYGMPGVETLLPLALDRFGPELTSLVCGAGPARVLGVADTKGSIAVGHDADLVLVDPLTPNEITARTLVGRAGWSPFEGTTTRGRVVSVWRRGDRIEGLDQRGGRHLPRRQPTPLPS